MKYDIYQEGFVVMEGHGRAIHLGSAEGETFIDACRNYIKETGQGEIRVDKNGNEYAADWGCRWFPTLVEAQKSYG